MVSQKERETEEVNRTQETKNQHSSRMRQQLERDKKKDPLLACR